MTDAPKGPDRGSQSPAICGDGEDVTLAHAGQVCIRHQPLGRFWLDYLGERPVVLIALDVDRGQGASPARRQGSFVLLAPGQPVRIDLPERLEVLALRFDDPEVLNRIGLQVEGAFRGADQSIRLLGQEIRRVLTQDGEPGLPFAESLANAVLVRIALMHSERRNGDAAKPRLAVAPFQVRRISDHVRGHLGERISVDDLAAIASLSRAHFSRAFAATTGETPHRFVLRERLAYVREALEREGGDLSALAVAAGFSSHAHMTVAFKEAFGETPSAHRDRFARKPATT